VVDYGLKHRILGTITAIGVDEVAYRLGHHYLTLVCQIGDGFKRLLFIGKGRSTKTLLKIFRSLGRERCENIKVVCSDM